MARRQRNYQEEYRRRTLKAISQGYPSYGVKRRVRRIEKIEAERQRLLTEDEFSEDDEIAVLDSYKAGKLNKLFDMGAERREIDRLTQMALDDDPAFWREFRKTVDQLYKLAG